MACACEPQTIGGILPTFVTPDTVRTLKMRIDPQVQATHAAVHDCSALSPVERASWAAFHGSWAAYRDSDASWWDAAAQFDQGKIFESSLAAWQDTLASKCKLTGPRVITTEESGPDLSAVKWAAAAVIVVAVVWGVRTVIR